MGAMTDDSLTKYRAERSPDVSPEPFGANALTDTLSPTGLFLSE
jgi:hypothetical protein